MNKPPFKLQNVYPCSSVFSLYFYTKLNYHVISLGRLTAAPSYFKLRLLLRMKIIHFSEVIVNFNRKLRTASELIDRILKKIKK